MAGMGAIMPGSMEDLVLRYQIEEFIHKISKLFPIAEVPFAMQIQDHGSMIKSHLLRDMFRIVFPHNNNKLQEIEQCLNNRSEITRQSAKVQILSDNLRSLFDERLRGPNIDNVRQLLQALSS